MEIVMQTNLEQVKEMIRALPIEDLDKLREVIDEEKKSKRENGGKLEQRLERYKKARKWLDENGEKYMNQWVCLEGDRLVAHGTDGLEVHRKAKEVGIESPFLHHIVDESLPFGGW